VGASDKWRSNAQRSAKRNVFTRVIDEGEDLIELRVAENRLVDQPTQSAVGEITPTRTTGQARRTGTNERDQNADLGGGRLGHSRHVRPVNCEMRGGTKQGQTRC
jgi:hypothetical protein